jgi:NADH-quinone oxidoreductase subunit K
MVEPISIVTLNHYLFTGALLFVLGLIGFVSRRNLIVIFLCTELMFQGVVVTLVAASRYHLNFDGQVFVIFVLTIAAAEAAGTRWMRRHGRRCGDEPGNARTETSRCRCFPLTFLPP